MTTIKISASCPYEIGDKIVTGREIHPPELAFKFPAVVPRSPTLCASTARRPGKPYSCMNWTGAAHWCGWKRRRGRRNGNNRPPERGKFSKEV